VAPDVDPDLEAECNPAALKFSRVKQNVKDGVDPALTDDGVDEALFKEEIVGDGDQFMAVKPWMGVVKNSVPTNYKPNKRNTEAPDASLQLEYVHGYRCHDARNNLRYTSTGEVVYHAAAAGIVLNQKTNT
jgi:microtubule-associated protein-like 6